MAVVSMNSMDQVQANLHTVRDFQPLSPERMREMRTSLNPLYRGERIALRGDRGVAGAVPAREVIFGSSD